MYYAKQLHNVNKTAAHAIVMQIRITRMRLMLARKRVRANNFTAKKARCVVALFNIYAFAAQSWENAQLVTAHNITLHISARAAKMRVMYYANKKRNNAAQVAKAKQYYKSTF